MIQRIQTVWLFCAAVIMCSIFYFNLYKFQAATFPPLHIGNDFIGIALAVVSIILSLITIFLFKNRKNQKSFIWLNILITIALQIWLFFQINNSLSKPAYISASGYYWIGIFIPLITIIFLFMAKAGIRKDEKLLKSLDRLR